MKTGRRPKRRAEAPQEAAPKEGLQRDRKIALAAALIVALGTAAYANSFAGVLVFDDINEIGENPAIRSLLPPWKAMLGGKDLPPRPIPYYSFAIDYALWGDWLPGWHLTNLVLHLSNALFIFGIARRTLLSPTLATRYGERATLLAFLVAAIWVAHPLQTQAVTYVYQRMESMMAFFFLGGLYAYIRSRDGLRREWFTVAVACSTLGMLCKESCIVLPLLIFLYDVLLTPRSASDALRARPGFYAALAASCVPLFIFLAGQGARYLEYRNPESRLLYALTQPEVVLHYLRLAVWPAGQCLDYWWEFIETPQEFIVPAVALAALVAFYLWVTSCSRQGLWLLAAVVLPLLPTSSVNPVAARAAEHRMYLSLAGLAAMAVIGVFESVRAVEARRGRLRVLRVGVAIIAVAVVASLATATHYRNRVYHSRLTMWRDVVQTASHSPSVWQNLALSYINERDWTNAAATARHILTIEPGHAGGHLALGMALLELGDLEGAAQSARFVLSLNPQQGSANLVLGTALFRGGDQAGALPYLARAVEESPDRAIAHVNLGVALRTIDPVRAMALLERALDLEPKNVEALTNLGNAHARNGDYRRALTYYDAALAAAPNDKRVRAAKRTAEDDLKAQEAGRAAATEPAR